jgi:Xaa-Pro aminopeptidase
MTDASLAALPVDADALDALLRGIAASPVADAPELWAPLVAEHADGALQRRLHDRLRQVAPDDGLSAGRAATAERLAALRAELERRGLDGFVVPRADAHQGEAVPPHASRLAWLTGFTGSAGLAVVLRDRAAIFVDGRYTLQAQNEVDTQLVEPRHLTEQPAEDWIAAHLAGGTLGYDPWLHTPEGRERLQRAVDRAGGTLAGTESNPVDAVWDGQPAEPLSPAVPHLLDYAGEAGADKRARLAAELSEAGTDAAVLTLPDSICWLLNARGRDVPNTPLVLSFALLHADGAVDWVVDARKVTPALRQALGNQVRLHDPAGFGALLDGLAGRRVLVDGASAPVWVLDRLTAAGASLERAADPCRRPKACKNATELAGARAAHERDGAALTRFLCWLSTTAAARSRDGQPVTEIEAAAALAAFRRADPLLRDIAFDTISGAGEHGAIVHYRVDETTNRALNAGELYLVDSGGQYLDGTTDVTRTLAIGTPSDEMRRRYTRVLKGHVALSQARFPEGTTGSQLDALARAPLWQAGLDYDHGTGHGVGSYLGVHEGPQRISKLPNPVKLEPGMICSNEPGYYKPGAYGIRIENLVAVCAAPVEDPDARPTLGFETLTLAPYCRALIDVALLTADEIAWIDAYQARVRETLAPHLDAATADWLAAETAPLG